MVDARRRVILPTKLHTVGVLSLRVQSGSRVAATSEERSSLLGKCGARGGAHNVTATLCAAWGWSLVVDGQDEYLREGGGNDAALGLMVVTFGPHEALAQDVRDGGTESGRLDCGQNCVGQRQRQSRMRGKMSRRKGTCMHSEDLSQCGHNAYCWTDGVPHDAHNADGPPSLNGTIASGRATIRSVSLRGRQGRSAGEGEASLCPNSAPDSSNGKHAAA